MKARLSLYLPPSDMDQMAYDWENGYIEIEVPCKPDKGSLFHISYVEWKQLMEQLYICYQDKDLVEKVNKNEQDFCRVKETFISFPAHDTTVTRYLYIIIEEN
jgi:hypothetical protein